MLEHYFDSVKSLSGNSFNNLLIGTLTNLFNKLEKQITNGAITIKANNTNKLDAKTTAIDLCGQDTDYKCPYCYARNWQD